MSFSFRLKSHPNKLLINHLKNVAELSKEIVSSKYMDNRGLLAEISYLNGISHDFGKATTYFQDMLDNGEGTKYANHGFVSALFGYCLTSNYLSKIKKLDEFWYMPVVTWIIIHKHHGNIKNVGENQGELSKIDDKNEIETCFKQIENIARNNFKEVDSILNEILKDYKLQDFINLFNNHENTKEFLKKLRKDVFKISRENDIKYYFYILFFYSVLLDSDKLDASESSLPARMDIPKNLIERYKKLKFEVTDAPINKVREKAYEEVNASLHELDFKIKRIFSINLPTGIGKTLAGLSFALNLREKVKDEFGFTPRIIYSLPFLSIIDQNSEVIKDILTVAGGYGDIPSNLFLKHHHLADIEYKEKREEDNELNIVKDIHKALLLTEGWHSEIVITTFIQFFHSLITNKNRAARKFHNMVNSIIILDEVQSIPHEYWHLIKVTLNYLADNFNCWIVFMTATQPLIFGKEEIKNLVESREEYFMSLDRVTFNFDLRGREFDKFKTVIYDLILKKKDKDILVVLNTIKSCKELYGYLKGRLSAGYNLDFDKYLDKDGICDLPDLALINLSTHILPDFRLKRIKRINQEVNKRKVIVTTQLIEAGVDISADIVYRDLAPLDCIIQTAGRCNRSSSREKGVVNVVQLMEENRAFYSYIYDSTLIDATKEVIGYIGENISEMDFTLKAANAYYELVVERANVKDASIIEDIKRLNFFYVAEEFRLLQDKLPEVTIFVEVDEKRERTRKKIEEIMGEKKGYERRKELLLLRKDLNFYSLSIRGGDKIIEEIKTHLPNIDEIENLHYVPQEMLNDWYVPDTGFNVPESDVKMRIV